jgi:hypothetical protein
VIIRVRPPRVKELNHEVELGVVIGKKAKFVNAANALDHIAGYALGLDMTVNFYFLFSLSLGCGLSDVQGRDLQDAAKKKGLPW